MDAADEKRCDDKPVYELYKAEFNWKPLLLLILVPIVVICAIIRGHIVSKRQRIKRRAQPLDNTAQTDFNGDRLFPMPAAVAGVKAPMRSDDRIERIYVMDNDSDISSFDQPSQENLIRAHSPHHINLVARTPTPVVNTMGGHVGPQGPHDDGVHPSAPPAESEYGSVSAPPSYRSPRDSISQPQSEPPSYPSSGAPSLMRQRQNRPSSSSISFRLRVPPPSYDEAMEKREEAKGFGEGGMRMQDLFRNEVAKIPSFGKNKKKKKDSSLKKQIDLLDMHYMDDTTTEEDESGDSDDY